MKIVEYHNYDMAGLEWKPRRSGGAVRNPRDKDDFYWNFRHQYLPTTSELSDDAYEENSISASPNAPKNPLGQIVHVQIILVII
jgi:hypothetical protein